jgi:hypothetical protein
MIQGRDDSILPILASSCANAEGIQLHSSQKINVMVFSVVRITVRHETNLLIFKHLQRMQPRFPQSVEIFFGLIPGVGFALEAWVPGRAAVHETHG